MLRSYIFGYLTESCRQRFLYFGHPIRLIRDRLVQIKARLTELEKIIPSVYEDKVAGRIPEDICVGLHEKYRKEQSELKKERTALEKKLADNAKNKNDVTNLSSD